MAVKPGEGHRFILPEQLRKTRIRIRGNSVGKGLHFDVLVVELGLRSAQMILPESPKRRGYCSIYHKDVQRFSFDWLKTRFFAIGSQEMPRFLE